MMEDDDDSDEDDDDEDVTMLDQTGLDSTVLDQTVLDQSVLDQTAEIIKTGEQEAKPKIVVKKLEAELEGIKEVAGSS